MCLSPDAELRSALAWVRAYHPVISDPELTPDMREAIKQAVMRFQELIKENQKLAKKDHAALAELVASSLFPIAFVAVTRGPQWTTKSRELLLAHVAALGWNMCSVCQKRTRKSHAGGGEAAPPPAPQEPPQKVMFLGIERVVSQLRRIDNMLPLGHDTLASLLRTVAQRDPSDAQRDPTDAKVMGLLALDADLHKWVAHAIAQPGVLPGTDAAERQGAAVVRIITGVTPLPALLQERALRATSIVIAPLLRKAGFLPSATDVFWRMLARPLLDKVEEPTLDGEGVVHLTLLLMEPDVQNSVYRVIQSWGSEDVGLAMGVMAKYYKILTEIEPPPLQLVVDHFYKLLDHLYQRLVHEKRLVVHGFVRDPNKSTQENDMAFKALVKATKKRALDADAGGGSGTESSGSLGSLGMGSWGTWGEEGEADGEAVGEEKSGDDAPPPLPPSTLVQVQEACVYDDDYDGCVS